MNSEVKRLFSFARRRMNNFKRRGEMRKCPHPKEEEDDESEWKDEWPECCVWVVSRRSSSHPQSA